MLSAVNATPGYLAGPIDPGRWALALGPLVLKPLGLDWHARITLTRGVQPSLRPIQDAGAAAHRSKPGWYRGDLHTHTVHSDGKRQQGGESRPDQDQPFAPMKAELLVATLGGK